MYCVIYKSKKKQNTYLYVAAKDDFDAVPETLLGLLGEPVYVMELDLSQIRKLAQEDVLQVMKNLQEKGWHLQLPPPRDQASKLH
jgi:uncharacterized protein YcgL (UPF0745 family)